MIPPLEMLACSVLFFPLGWLCSFLLRRRQKRIVVDLGKLTAEWLELPNISRLIHTAPLRRQAALKGFLAEAFEAGVRTGVDIGARKGGLK
jgi:hypothetical protein